MRVLYLVPYFHDDEYSPYKRFGTGLSFTLASIINKTASLGNEVSVYAQSAFSPGFRRNNIVYLPKRIRNLFPLPIRYLKAFYVDKKGTSLGIKKYIHVLSYYLFGGYIERIIKEVKPDIVSIRGSGYITKPFIIACERLNQKYVISLHGINSLNKNTTISENEKEMERELFRQASSKNIHLTVIASGIKDRMLSTLSIEDSDHIHVVNNGIDSTKEIIDQDKVDAIKSKYGIRTTDKVIISAGSICERKNQLQLLKAFHLLPDAIKENTKVLFCGEGPQYDELKNTIIQLHEDERVFACGFIPNTEMSNYYSISNLNAIVSIDEGFGRAFVEGFLSGVPALAFKDLDAVADLYSPDVMISIDGRSDKDLMSGIMTALEKPWDKGSIIKHGENFSVDAMVKKYLDVYKACIEE